MASDPRLEEMLGQMGDFGRYQFRQLVFLFVTSFLSAFAMLHLSFIAPTPDFKCIPSAGNTIATLHCKKGGETMHYVDHCLQMALSSNTTLNCEKFLFNTTSLDYRSSIDKSSKVVEYNMVCSHAWERQLLQTVYMFGVMNGAIFLGSAADKFGRKRILCISGAIQVVVGVSLAFVHNYYLHLFVIFCYGVFGSGGASVTGFVLASELIGKKYRNTCGSLFSVWFACGEMLMALWGYLIRDVNYLQIFFGLHYLLLIGHYWFVDESILWLWGQGRTEEAIKIVKKAVEENGGEFQDSFADVAHEPNTDVERQSPLSDGPTEKHNICDLFKTKRMRTRALILSLNWFANSLVYYGITLNAQDLYKGNRFLSSFLGGLAEFPGIAIAIFAVPFTGQRTIMAAALSIGGIFCVIGALMPKDDNGNATVLVIVMLNTAKIAISVSFTIIYTYSAAVFPTVIRNSAMGFCVMSARIAGMSTPMISLLKHVNKCNMSIELHVALFGVVAIVASFFGLFLPATFHAILPQTLEEGEAFGTGDTAFNVCCKRKAAATVEEEQPISSNDLSSTSSRRQVDENNREEKTKDNEAAYKTNRVIIK